LEADHSTVLHGIQHVVSLFLPVHPRHLHRLHIQIDGEHRRASRRADPGVSSPRELILCTDNCRSALFFLFSAMMFGSHVYLVITGKTTVESFRGRDQHEREAEVLQQEFGILWHNFDKRRVRKRWKEEFGGVPVDGRWRFGTAGQMWKQDMGESWWGWICKSSGDLPEASDGAVPVGRPLGDGIHFQSNPHFGPNGEWLRKQDWPKDLQ
jgi:hypothetical protein